MSDYSIANGISTDTTTLSKTGTGKLSATNTEDVQCNIYDMSGSVKEWTTETRFNPSYTNGPCVARGSHYNYNNASTYCTSNRWGIYTNYAPDSIGFRVVLYL